MRGVRHQQVVAVGRRLGDQFGADHAAGTGTVVDDHALPPDLEKMRRQRACEHVGGAAGRNRHDDAHGTVRVGLRRGRCGSRRQNPGQTGAIKTIHGEIVICNKGVSR